jgi:hypothetical protein
MDFYRQSTIPTCSNQSCPQILDIENRCYISDIQLLMQSRLKNVEKFVKMWKSFC